MPICKTGLYRPPNCPKYCIYNGDHGCDYKFGVKLKNRIESWQKCQYFKSRDEQKKPQQKFFDYMYGRIASFKDSHSARWTE